jgi:antitoxin PrlF
MHAKLSVSSRGLVVLPSAMLEAAGIRTHDIVIAETTQEGILLRPAVTLPVESYSGERIGEFDAAEAEVAEVFGAAGASAPPLGTRSPTMRSSVLR